MSDDKLLTPGQKDITSAVHAQYEEMCKLSFSTDISTKEVSQKIKRLKKCCSPGIDGVTTEHLYYANSKILCHYLKTVLSYMLQYTIVPPSFTTGIIVPVLKRSTLNPNQVESYRPITLSTTYSKLMELFLLPSDNTVNTQFGFKEKRGADFACGLLSDIICYAKGKGSPIYTCSLDAEKCFDRIWHDGLFYKLLDILPKSHWVFLYKLYTKLNAKVKWKGMVSEQFQVTRGTRQGSILSPALFKIFIDELLQKLICVRAGIHIGDQKYNSFAYADDISLFSLTSTGLQDMIDCCVEYAEKWRISFGVKKSKCMIVGKPVLKNEPDFYLGQHQLSNENSLDILGVTFDRCGSAESHINNRAGAARRAFYRAISRGVSYPGLATDVKAHLWRTWVAPVMSYGVVTLPITVNHLKSMDTLQAKQVKQFMGLGHRTHHTNLMQALGIDKMSSVITKALRSFFYRVMSADTPYRNLVTHQLASHIGGRTVVKGTLVHKLLQSNVNPTEAMIIKKSKTVINPPNGTTETIQYLVNQHGYNQLGSFEHRFTQLLVKAF